MTIAVNVTTADRAAHVYKVDVEGRTKEDLTVEPFSSHMATVYSTDTLMIQELQPE